MYHKYILQLYFQGGPGGSGSGYGNFEEIGPLDMNLNKRNESWVRDACRLTGDVWVSFVLVLQKQ